MMEMMEIMMAAARIMSLPIGAESLSGATMFPPPPVALSRFRVYRYAGVLRILSVLA
jgi:hypothetical protein